MNSKEFQQFKELIIKENWDNPKTVSFPTLSQSEVYMRGRKSIIDEIEDYSKKHKDLLIENAKKEGN